MSQIRAAGVYLPAPELQAIKSAEEDLNDVPGYTPMAQVTYWSSDPYGSTSGKAVDMKTGAQVFAPNQLRQEYAVFVIIRCAQLNLINDDVL